MSSQRNHERNRQQSPRTSRSPRQSSSRQGQNVKGKVKQKSYPVFDRSLLVNDLQKDLRRLKASEENRDVELKLGESVYHVHKFILKARCPFLFKKIVKTRTIDISWEGDIKKQKENILTDTIRDIYESCDSTKDEIDHHAVRLFREKNEEDESELEGLPVEGRLNEKDDSSQKGVMGCCTLGNDLLHALNDEETSDLSVKVSDKEILVHRTFLSIRSPYFEAMLQGGWSESEKMIIDLQNVSYEGVLFVLQFMYGGVSNIPECVSTGEVLQMADMYGLELLKSVVAHHLKFKYCHGFHKPCSDCTSSVLDVIQLTWTFGPKQLFDECLRWISQYYSKIFVRKDFLRLEHELQNECVNAVLRCLTPANVVEQLKECEVMESRLPNVKSAEPLREFRRNLEKKIFSFLVINLESVITTAGFLDVVKGVGWSDQLLEKILNELVSSLSIGTCCKTFTCIQKVNQTIGFLETATFKEQQESPFSQDAKAHLQKAEKGCLAYIGGNIRSVQTSTGWKDLSEETKETIKENSGFFDLSALPDRKAAPSSARYRQGRVAGSQNASSDRNKRR